MVWVVEGKIYDRSVGKGRQERILCPATATVQTDFRNPLCRPGMHSFLLQTHSTYLQIIVHPFATHPMNRFCNSSCKSTV